MELNVRFTVRLSPDAWTRIMVLVVVIITGLAARETGYGPGTAFPAAALTALVAALQAAGQLARPRTASLPRA